MATDSRGKEFIKGAHGGSEHDLGGAIRMSGKSSQGTCLKIPCLVSTFIFAYSWTQIEKFAHHASVQSLHNIANVAIAYNKHKGTLAGTYMLEKEGFNFHPRRSAPGKTHISQV